MPDDFRSIPALLPRDPDGHQFVCYADCCSGIPGRGNAERFAAVNAVLRRLDPQPEFILFPGDEIQGLVSDPDILREQWRYWFAEEMAWLDRDAIPLYHTTANHTVYDPSSEAIFRDVMAHLPRNGPPGQEGLSYFVQRGNLLMVFINTLWSGLGGEGRVETDWLDATLAAHSDATHKLVIGHHPVFPTNGFSGDWQRQIEKSDGQKLWQILVHHGVVAYLCSHMLAFDVQVHQGVLQILSAGAGTAPLMPETEYHHLVQLAIDQDGLRYQVLDTTGAVRESLTWPIDETEGGKAKRRKGGEGEDRKTANRSAGDPEHAPSHSEPSIRHSERSEESLAAAIPERSETPLADLPSPRLADSVIADSFSASPPFRLSAYIVASPPLRLFAFDLTLAPDHPGDPQTLICGWRDDPAPFALWIGLRGPEQRLAVLIQRAPGRSPHLWLGPVLKTEDGETADGKSLPVSPPSRLPVSSLPVSPSSRLSVSVVLHTTMGPGGILWRWNDEDPWSSMENASSWGAEDLPWPTHWSTGCSRSEPDNQPFRGTGLEVSWVSIDVNDE